MSDITDSPEYGQSAPGTFSSSYNSYDDSDNENQIDTEQAMVTERPLN